VSTIPGDRATFTFTNVGQLDRFQRTLSRDRPRDPRWNGRADSLDMFIPIPSEAPQKAVFTLPGLTNQSPYADYRGDGVEEPGLVGCLHRWSDPSMSPRDLSGDERGGCRARAPFHSSFGLPRITGS